MKNFSRTLVHVVATAGIAAGVGLFVRTGPSPAAAGPAVTSVPVGSTVALPVSNISDIAEGAVDSVVNISTTQQAQLGPASFDPFFNDPNSPFFVEPQERKQSSLGSGVVITAQGRILTNAHVVNGADTIKVTIADGTEYPAKLIGLDAASDVAVIQMMGNPPTMKPLPIADSSQLRLGEVVLAIGDPFGVGQAVTMGIVSAKGRASVGIEHYEDFIQTDAAINPGNSGGALINMRGELVGVNTAILSRSGGYQGIGFAIPSNMAVPIMNMLIKDGKVSRGYLGVNIVTINSEIAEAKHLDTLHGVLIGGLDPAGPGAKAGMRDGDVVVAVDGEPVRDAGKLRNAIATRGAGTKIHLDLMRGKVAQKLDATLGELPATATQPQQPTGLVPQQRGFHHRVIPLQPTQP